MSIIEHPARHLRRFPNASAVVIFAGIAACTYQPGVLTAKYPDASATVGCIDIAAEALDDKKAEGPAAKLFVANRCDAPVVVDYLTIYTTVHYTDGHEGVVRIYDPHNLVRPVTLDARTRGWEAFEFQPDDPDDNDRVPEQLCLEVSRIDGKEPSVDARWICLATANSDLTKEEIR